MSRVQALEPGRPWTMLSICLTNDEGIRPLKRDYFGLDQSTDVVSFAYEPMPGHPEGWTGEIIVNAECALREGPRHHGADYELAFYIAHGCHHLSGADDADASSRDAMHRIEQQWLAEAASTSPLGPFFKEPRP